MDVPESNPKSQSNNLQRDQICMNYGGIQRDKSPISIKDTGEKFQLILAMKTGHGEYLTCLVAHH